MPTDALVYQTDMAFLTHDKSVWDTNKFANAIFVRTKCLATENNSFTVHHKQPQATLHCIHHTFFSATVHNYLYLYPFKKKDLYQLSPDICLDYQ